MKIFFYRKRGTILKEEMRYVRAFFPFAWILSIVTLPTLEGEECDPPAPPEQCGCVLRDEQILETYTYVKVRVSDGDAATPSSASGSVFARASALVTGSFSAISYTCSTVDCSEPADQVVNSASDSSGDLIANGLSVSPSANDGYTQCPGWIGSGIAAAAHADAGDGYATAEGEARLNITFEHREYCGSACYCAPVLGNEANLADSKAQAYVHWGYPSGTNPTITTTVWFNWSFVMYQADCGGYSQVWAFDDELLEPQVDVSFYSVTNDWHAANGTSQTTVTQGLIANVFDGTITQQVCLGSFPQFTANCPPSGQFEVQHEAPQGNNVDISSVETTVLIDSFANLDGDLDGNGYLCANDRAEMLAAQGSIINVDAAYNPRADFDLDGVIDSDDLTPFDALFYAQPDCNNNGNPDACDIATGNSQDTDSNGVPDECEPPYGACCRPDGACELALSENCDGPCDVYGGEGVLCGEVTCPSSPLKACCKPHYQGCEVMTECECNAINGLVINSTTCSGVFCPAKIIELP